MRMNGPRFLYWRHLSTVFCKANDSPTVPTDKVKAIIKAQGEILVPATAAAGMQGLNLSFPWKVTQISFDFFFFFPPPGRQKEVSANVILWALKLKCDEYEWNNPEMSLKLLAFKVCHNSDWKYWSWLSLLSLLFLLCCLCSVCARWWATQAACGHPRWETTLLSAAPLIAHSRSGTQRQENVSTPFTGIPQQCAACTYMRKGMGRSHCQASLSVALKEQHFLAVYSCTAVFLISCKKLIDRMLIMFFLFQGKNAQYFLVPERNCCSFCLLEH